jgi:subtilisin
MHRRIAPVFLAVLIALPLVVPVSAAEPTATQTPAVEPAATPEPSATPTAGPSADPAPEPSANPTAEPGVDAIADPGAAPVPATDPAPDTAAASGEIPDATGRYIVMLRTGTDTAAVVEKARKRDGVKADRSYTRAFRGFAAKLDKKQKTDLLADPNVLAVVPDAVTHLAQTTPTGVSRIGGLTNPIARIDGTDQRVDADVAIVDTGITAHPDLNIAGGYNCSTSDRSAWRDREGHGTHVAGIVGALDNSFGVVGVAPGARVWGVKILNDDGNGLISWYICGLDWILAQRDPNDANRPLFEAVNMSVTKDGVDDHNCGRTQWDALHQAICRVVAGGITVVAAAGNNSRNAAANIPAAYDEVLTVSALADTDGSAGGAGGNRCLSWGGYDQDDTFADFSNYGADIDLIAPGKCILSTVPGPGYSYMSGTSMATPAVAGAVALYKSSRPDATPAEVREALQYLGNLNWKYWTDPDSNHERLLDVSRIDTLGTFSLAPTGGSALPTAEGASTASVPVSIVRSRTFFERVNLAVTALPAGWTASPAAGPLGWSANTGFLSVVVPKGTAAGRYDIEVEGTNQGRTQRTTVSVNVVEDSPTAQPPVVALAGGATMVAASLNVRVSWPAASDPSSAIAGYEVQVSKGGGPWGATIARTAGQRDFVYTLAYDVAYRLRVRAVDTAGNWSPWAQGVRDTILHPIDDRSTSIVRKGNWARVANASAWRGTETGSSTPGASVRMSFSGRSIAIVGPTNRYRGRAKVYIDGVYITTINMRTAVSTSRRVVFTRALSSGTHAIALVAMGSGASSVFRLDAFVILR